MTTRDQAINDARAATTVQADGSCEPGSGADGSTLSPMLEIANALVHLYKEAFGRGPTKARAQLAGPDMLVVTLENSLTVLERNLALFGEHDRIRETRMYFHGALEQPLRDAVETVLGRRTRACVSGIDPFQDVAVEVFTLEPQDGRVSQSAP